MRNSGSKGQSVVESRIGRLRSTGLREGRDADCPDRRPLAIHIRRRLPSCFFFHARCTKTSARNAGQLSARRTFEHTKFSPATLNRAAQGTKAGPQSAQNTAKTYRFNRFTSGANH